MSMTYHPERAAEALLDAAGYPRGADGYRFKLKICPFQTGTIRRIREIVMGYFEAIGVDSELFMPILAAESFPLLTWRGHARV